MCKIHQTRMRQISFHSRFTIHWDVSCCLNHYRKLRKDIPSKILIQLCLALLLLNLVYLVDAWLALYPDAMGLCISTAWFLHYFLLVSFTWMGLEAVHMYLALVKVFNSYISQYMLKFSLVGWGVPMIVVIIVIAIDKDNYGIVSYGKFSDGTSDDLWVCSYKHIILHKLKILSRVNKPFNFLPSLSSPTAAGWKMTLPSMWRWWHISVSSFFSTLSCSLWCWCSCVG